MTEALAQLPPLIASHLLLAAAAMTLALVIGLPLGLVAARRPRIGSIALGLAGLIQTIPGLALLALFYPLLLWIGHGIPALGFLPALLALTLYALLPILRNTVAGLNGIDPAIRQAADAVGMTAGQRLRLVELPLAAPVAMAGIRTACVWTIGAATLATTVGYSSLGNPIFSGLQTETWALVLAGCFGAAGLAIAADLILALIEHGLAARKPWRVRIGAALLAIGLAAALAPRFLPQEKVVTIGAKNFSEQFILARLIGARLEQAGYHARYREGLGSAVALQALTAGDIDAYVEYSGTLWTGPMARRDSPPRAAMLGAVGRWVADKHAALLGPLGFENAYALVMRPDAGLRTIEDLAGRAPGLALGADLEFLDRPEWAALRAAYGLHFRDSRPYSPTFMYRALESRQADVISAFSSDGRIAADKLIVLGDPKQAIPRYDAVLLVAPARAGDRKFREALQPLVDAIPVSAMRTANYMVDRDADKRTPEDAARWLAGQIKH
jgi:osmoprotectant transport system permease protein